MSVPSGIVVKWRVHTEAGDEEHQQECATEDEARTLVTSLYHDPMVVRSVAFDASSCLIDSF